MPIQVAAHNFELTDGIRDNIIEETKDKIQPLAVNNFTIKWTLSIEAEDHVAHVTWADGPLHGDVTCKTNDMYATIHQCAKKTSEQIKKAHAKRFEKRPPNAQYSELSEVESDLEE